MLSGKKLTTLVLAGLISATIGLGVSAKPAGSTDSFEFIYSRKEQESY